MEARLSHALVAVVAAALTAGAYEVRDAFYETAVAVGSSPAAKALSAGAAPQHAEAKDETKTKDERKEVRKEDRKDKIATRATDLGVSEEELKYFRLEKKADDKGLTVDELRDKRQDAVKRKKPGLSLGADQIEARRDARADWRSKQDAGDLAFRKDARIERREDMSDDELAARDARKSYRTDVVETYPSVGDAAKVLEQLRVMGEAAGQPE